MFYDGIKIWKNLSAGGGPTLAKPLILSRDFDDFLWDHEYGIDQKLA